MTPIYRSGGRPNQVQGPGEVTYEQYLQRLQQAGWQIPQGGQSGPMAAQPPANQMGPAQGSQPVMGMGQVAGTKPAFGGGQYSDLMLRFGPDGKPIQNPSFSMNPGQWGSPIGQPNSGVSQARNAQIPQGNWQALVQALMAGRIGKKPLAKPSSGGMGPAMGSYKK